jgi:hypothetical protein
VIVCVACIVISAGLDLLTLIAATANAKWFATPFLIMLAAACLALVDSLVVRVEFNRQELFVRTLWRGRRLIPWSSVSGLGYSWAGHRKIDMGRYGMFVVSNYLAGSKSLTDLVRAKLLERLKTAR